ncbi:hypothetical protein CYMTET_41895 [Cymbomonas tetramitiformis]|uniref:Polycystin cation channel PKD1/PKD2 domain-containing protein n=1 Tax=Cymbomonas tetramitiformis TaxID=36881 RepID=A0AAE0C747_9CHLO|nr:hypothetical protein CYMTET_41895 [Cymbomonas tetramitiformis]
MALIHPVNDDTDNVVTEAPQISNSVLHSESYLCVSESVEVPENTPTEEFVKTTPLAPANSDVRQSALNVEVQGLLMRKAQRKVMDLTAKDRVIRKTSATEVLVARQGRKDVLLSASLFLFVMFVYFSVVISQRRVEDSFNMEFAIKDYVSSLEYETELSEHVLDDIRDYTALWSWIDQAYLPALFPEPQWYNGDDFTKEESGYFLQYNRLIGGFKMVQQRVASVSCVKTSESRNTGENCPGRFNKFYPNLWMDDTSEEAYGPAHDPNKYTFDPDELAGDGGFPVFVAPDKKEAHIVIAELMADRWIDKQTRELRITFNAYNANLLMFTVFQLSFEFGNSGRIEKEIKADTFRIEHYNSVDDKIRGGFEVFLFLYVGGQVVGEFADLYNRRYGERRRLFRFREYISDLGNWIDLVRISLFAFNFILWLKILGNQDAANLKLPLPESQIFYSLDDLASLHELSAQAHAITIVLCMLTTFKYINTSAKYGIVVRTIIVAAPSLFQFLVMFLICFMVFSVVGVVLFGHILEEWSTVGLGCSTLIMMITGEYGMESLIEIKAVVGPLYYSMFLIIVFFLLVNILLAILMDAYASLKEENLHIDEKSKLNFELNLIKEVFLQSALWFYKYYRKLRGLEYEVFFLTNEKMLDMLCENAELTSQAIQLEMPATMLDPDPEPVEFYSFEILRRHYTDHETKLLLMTVGNELEDCEEEIQEYFKQQRSKSREGERNKRKIKSVFVDLVSALSPRAEKTNKSQQDNHGMEDAPAENAPGLIPQPSSSKAQQPQNDSVVSVKVKELQRLEAMIQSLLLQKEG